MLKCLPELSSIFGVDKSDFLVQQCFSGINRKDFKVRVQVLRTLGSLSLRVGAQKVAEYVLPLIEMLLEDPEDFVILENVRMASTLLKLRLVAKKSALRILEHLLPFLLYPNAQIRHSVATFV